MPTISQLPAATAISPADTIPVSQGGTLRSVSVGTFLETSQPTISVGSPSLIGRVSLGAGGPEQVDIGAGLSITGSTIRATGLDHATYPALLNLDLNTDLVVCDVGNPALLPVAQLRNLFSAGENISISPSGVISTFGTVTSTESVDLGSAIGALEPTAKLSALDLVPVSQSGVGRAISYSNLLDGLTIDQAQPAGSAADTDTFWVAQGSSLMERQTFSAIWSWIIGKLPAYMAPSIEITANLALQAAQHNGRLLICSQPVIVTIGSTLPAGFNCTVINASSGSVTFGPGFVISSGTTTLAQWQAATVMGLVYSSGAVAFVSLPAQVGSFNAPGAVTSLTATATNSSTIVVSWQPPANSTGSETYSIQYRVTGTSTWAVGTTAQSVTSYTILGLAGSTSYDVTVQASDVNGVGPYSNILTLTTTAASQTLLPAQVSGLTASAASATSVQLAWSAQTGTSAATSYTVQYRVTDGSTWTWTLVGVTTNSAVITGLQASTNYDFVVYGLNSAGPGASSLIATAATPAAPSAVSGITWNVPPAGPYAKGIGAIGVNAHVTPATAAIQFGVSPSSTVAPTAWTTASYVNSDLWGAYVPTPSTSGNWYMWVEGIDGSAQSVCATPFVVQ